MSDVWIVLIEDRHTDTDARPFSTEDGAIAAARQAATANAREPGDVDWDAELNPAMRNDGWVLYLPYGTEGDNVRVLKRTLDGQS